MYIFTYRNIYAPCYLELKKAFKRLSVRTPKVIIKYLNTSVSDDHKLSQGCLVLAFHVLIIDSI